MTQLASSVEAIVHLAAVVDHEACMRDPELANHANSALLAIEAGRMLLQQEGYLKAHESGDPPDLGRVSGKPK